VIRGEVVRFFLVAVVMFSDDDSLKRSGVEVLEKTGRTECHFLSKKSPQSNPKSESFSKAQTWANAKPGQVGSFEVDM
jgi:hypothetical protein